MRVQRSALSDGEKDVERSSWLVARDSCFVKRRQGSTRSMLYGQALCPALNREIPIF